MASTDPSSATTGDPDYIPPGVAVIIGAFAKAIRAPINFVLIVTIFAAMLIPILVVLFWFSTPTSRKQPLFVLNVASILMGIGIAIWGIYVDVCDFVLF